MEYDADNFQPLLDLINKKLKPLHMEIRHGKSEDDGKAYYALVSLLLYCRFYDGPYQYFMSGTNFFESN